MQPVQRPSRFQITWQLTVMVIFSLSSTDGGCLLYKKRFYFILSSLAMIQLLRAFMLLMQVLMQIQPTRHYPSCHLVLLMSKCCLLSEILLFPRVNKKVNILKKDYFIYIMLKFSLSFCSLLYMTIYCVEWVNSMIKLLKLYCL